MAFYECGGGLPTQEKSITATTSQQIVLPDTGFAMSKVTVNPQNHSGSATPASRTSSYDLGQNHNVRYINTNSVPNTNANFYVAWVNPSPSSGYIGASTIYSTQISNHSIGASGYMSFADFATRVKNGTFSDTYRTVTSAFGYDYYKNYLILLEDYYGYTYWSCLGSYMHSAPYETHKESSTPMLCTRKFELVYVPFHTPSSGLYIGFGFKWDESTTPASVSRDSTVCKPLAILVTNDIYDIMS